MFACWVVGWLRSMVMVLAVFEEVLSSTLLSVEPRICNEVGGTDSGRRTVGVGK